MQTFDSYVTIEIGFINFKLLLVVFKYFQSIFTYSAWVLTTLERHKEDIIFRCIIICIRFVRHIYIFDTYYHRRVDRRPLKNLYFRSKVTKASRSFLHIGISIYADMTITSKYEKEITYPFPNSNDGVVDVWEWIINFLPTLDSEDD